MIVLGIDPGERRIGVAVSDPLGVAARPVRVIEHESLAADVARLAEIAAACKAETIVVGLPLETDGTAGLPARRARRFANALRRKSGLEVVLWDERLTSAEAEKALISAGRRPRDLRQLVDKTAAAVILQDYLDAQHKGVRQ